MCLKIKSCVALNAIVSGKTSANINATEIYEGTKSLTVLILA